MNTGPGGDGGERRKKNPNKPKWTAEKKGYMKSIKQGIQLDL